MKSVILSTEALNSYGTWLPVSGAILDSFIANPVMFYDHRSYSMLPIGKWENIRIEGDKIIADPVFDDDEQAQQIKKKFLSGSIRGASIGADIIEESSDPKWLKPGQTRPTIIKYEIFEASLTPLPANKECLTLKLRRNGIYLSNTNINNVLPLLNKKEMKEIALKLKLSESATEEDILQQIDLLQKEKELLEKYVLKLTEKLNEKQKAIFNTLLNTDIEKAFEFFDIVATKEKDIKISELLKASKSDDLNKETFDYLQKNNPQKLYEIKNSNPQLFEILLKEHLLTYKK